MPTAAKCKTLWLDNTLGGSTTVSCKNINHSYPMITCAYGCYRSMSGAAGVQSGPGDEEVGRSEQVCAGTYTLPERHLPTSSNGQQATL
eukprot:1155240-Pelagomonas_calceolata.AAC.2